MSDARRHNRHSSGPEMLPDKSAEEPPLIPGGADRDRSQPLTDPMRYVRYERQQAAAQIQRSLAAWNGRGAIVQRLARGETPAPDAVAAAAKKGTRDGGEKLPHLDQIQRSFGRHNISGVKAHLGPEAASANEQMQAEAFATGDHIAFAGSPSLHTAAHEAAHVVQQRAGVHLKSNVGESGDTYEHQADAVADAVVAGQSAEHLLDDGAGQGGERGAASHEHAAEAHRGAAVQKISHTAAGKTQAIDIGTLDEAACKEHLSRMARVKAGAGSAEDKEYKYDSDDGKKLKDRLAAIADEKAATNLKKVVADLSAQIASLGTATDFAKKPPWDGKNPTDGGGNETIASGTTDPASVIAAWHAFLGPGPYSHKHPRTGKADATKLVSADGKRSIRYGAHETGSNATKHHYHEETWKYDSGSNTMTVDNLVRRVPVK